MENIVIRKYKSGDEAQCQELNQIVDLWKHGRNAFKVDLDDIKSHYIDGSGAFWVAMDKDLIVGMIGLKNIGDMAGYVKRFKVHPDYQRKGIGTELLKTLIDWSKIEKFKHILCCSSLEETVAHNLYAKFDFQKMGVVRNGENYLLNRDL